jgi:hypothetical protein
MGDLIAMSARREITNRLRAAYQRASKKDKGRILDQVVSATGLARVSARRLLTGPGLPAPSEQIDGRTVRKRRYSDDARRLLIHVWSLMGRPNSKYFAVMRHEWMPLLHAGGDLRQPFAVYHRFVLCVVITGIGQSDCLI